MTDEETAPGSTKLTRAARRVDRMKRAVAFSQRVLPVVIPMHKRGASLRDIAAALEAQGIAAPRGGSKWHPQTVRRVLSRK